MLNGGRAVNVGRNRQHFFLALGDEVLGQFGGGGGFTRTLQTRHQDHCGRLCRQIDVRDPLAHGGCQFFLHDAHQHLPRSERAQYLLPQGFVFHAGNKVTHHRQRHVGFEQCHAHFTQHIADIGLGDAGLAADLFDQLGEFVAERGCHSYA